MVDGAPISQQEKITGRVDFEKRDFDVLIEQKGLILLHELATRCSCNREVNGAPLPNCVNCTGSGFVFTDACEIKGVIQDIGYNPKYQQYSEANAGMAQLTLQHEDSRRLGWFDRFTVEDGTNIYSENRFPIIRDLGSGDELSALLTYPPLDGIVDKAFLFVDSSTPHIVLEPFEPQSLTPLDFEIDGREIKLSTAFRDAHITSGEDKIYISVRYKHKPQYYVMDIGKDIRNTNTIGTGGVEKLKALPIHCTLKKAHYVMGDQGLVA